MDGQRKASRSPGLTVVGVFMLFLAIGGFANAVVMPSALRASPFPLGSPAAQFVSALTSPTYVASIWLYAITAGFTALGSFFRSRWTHRAFFAWGLSSLLGGAGFLLAAPDALIWGGKIAGFTFLAVLAFLLFLAYRYIQRQVGDQSAAP
jgi:hypothetical protein